MFEKFRQAPAIVFDLRGVPAEDCGGFVASRLTSDADLPFAIVTGPIVSSPDLPRKGIANPSSSYFFLATIPRSSLWKYKGRTVMLVDERTIDNAEGVGLMLEAANKTEIVGSPSAGAYSVFTSFVVPGGVTVSFSGEDFRHANGGKLQRLGLQPNLTVEPSLNGVRMGKDEVLDKALDLIAPKLPSSKVLPARASNGIVRCS
jgi:C-terminal processing protease CtpA/Prc